MSKKLTKEDIGQPFDFRHVQHIGWNPLTGYETENVDPNLKRFLNETKDNITGDTIFYYIEKDTEFEEILTDRQRPEMTDSVAVPSQSVETPSPSTPSTSVSVSSEDCSPQPLEPLVISLDTPKTPTPPLPPSVPTTAPKPMPRLSLMKAPVSDDNSANELIF